MLDVILSRENKSFESKAFEYWLRTGIRLRPIDLEAGGERKFNPYHDPDDGRFTFAPGGGTLPPRASRIGRARSASARSSARHRPAAAANGAASIDQAVDQPGNGPRLILAQFRPGPRAGIGGNGGPPLNDPLTLEQVFPRTANTPVGTVISVADNILDLTGPGARLTSSLAADHANLLIRQIRVVDPSFRYESLGFPSTFDGQINMIRDLRVKRATAIYRIRRKLGPMQVEALRHMQEQADLAYEVGVRLYETGQLRVRLSREEAIGNFVDREVRRRLRRFYNQHSIEVSREGPIRVIGREYDTSGSDRTYRIPDARVGEIAFDVSLTRKTLATQQVRGFFNADFRPERVVIVRPRQLGPGSTYAIERPR